MCFSHNTKHLYFQVISFVNSKDVTMHNVTHNGVNMFNLHIKQTEISQKRSKKTKNRKRCYFVILSVLLNKTNLISVS